MSFLEDVRSFGIGHIVGFDLAGKGVKNDDVSDRSLAQLAGANQCYNEETFILGARAELSAEEDEPPEQKRHWWQL